MARNVCAMFAFAAYSLLVAGLVQGSSFAQRNSISTASIPVRTHGYSRRRSPLLRSTRKSWKNKYTHTRNERGGSQDNRALRTYRLASSKTTRSSPSTTLSPMNPPQVSYSDLSPFGRVVAGTVEICFSTLLEYFSGFMGGYFLGTLTGIPRLVATPIQPEIQQTFFRELSARTVRMHGKSFGWAKQWGGISAAFGGFRVATKVIRGGVEDEWNTIMSSMAAGAYFARKEGPTAMIRGAVVYGGFMYLLSGGLFAKKEPFQYEERPIDF